MESIPKIIHPSWHQHLLSVFQHESLKKLKYEILPNSNFHPDSVQIFNVFRMPLDEIKVVILGQDPYPTPGNAIGFSFAVPHSKKKPKSLKIIEEEVINSKATNKEGIDMLSWFEQGVFLLNTALTVESGKPGTHLKYWEYFTQEVIKTVASKGAIWLLWGKKAQENEKYIKKWGSSPPNYILKAPHPAAELYSGGKAGFYGCNHFNRVNELLDSKIIW